MMFQLQAISVLTVVNILLLLGIMILTVRAYRQLPAAYTRFQIIFTALFLLQHLVSGYFLFTMMDFYVPAVGTHILILEALQTIAFGYLLWMEWQ